MTDLRPDIPASCAHRPTVGGLVAPYVNARMADGGVDFRTPHTAKVQRCWEGNLCQTCGRRLPMFVVVFGGPNQLRSLRFDEPPVCPPCAMYVSQACPMVAGRQPRYASGPRVSEGKRGHVCATAGCGCGGWQDTDPTVPDHGGDPAHAWYACWVPIQGWSLLASEVETPCTMGGCAMPVHRRLLIGACQLNEAPRKIMLVSDPGRGRVWERVSYAEAIAT